MILFDTETRERIGEYQARGRRASAWLGFDPRGGSLAIVGSERPSGREGYLHIIDAATAAVAQLGLRSAAIPADPGCTTSRWRPTPRTGGA